MADLSLQDWLAAKAAARRRDHLDRQRIELGPREGARVQLNGRWLVDFSSNDYLGLASDPDFSDQARKEVRATGSGASALVSGYSEDLCALERETAGFLGRDCALVFPSGYQANLAVISALAGRGDHVVMDRLCHASLIDGARLSGARISRYAHAEMAALKQRLAGARSGNRLLVSDGVFSMDGDVAPLAELARISQESNAWLMIDDAHGIGALGPGGRGTVSAAGLDQSAVPVLTGTFGKAFGCSGAFVAGSEELIGHIVNTGRTYMFTTAMPPVMAATVRLALKKVIDGDQRRSTLQARIREFRAGAERLGLELLPSESPIQALVTGDPRTAVAMALALREAGFLVVAIRPPTVPAGTSRLRITLSAAHDSEQVTGLLEALAQCATA